MAPKGAKGRDRSNLNPSETPTKNYCSCGAASPRLGLTGIFFILALWLLWTGGPSQAVAQGWDMDYEQRAQEVIAGLTRVNGLLGWTANNPSSWPEIVTTKGPAFKAERPDQGVLWRRASGPAGLSTLILANLKLQRVADFSRLPHLDRLDVYGNQLRGLNLDGNHSLTVVTAMKNQLGGIKLSSCPDLRRLSLSNNQLKEIDVSANPRLSVLFLSANRLTELDLSRNPELAELEVMNNQLGGLDLSANPLLTRLLASYNRIGELDLMANHQLTELGIRNNELTKLDLNFNPKLTNLNVSRNRLNELDLSSARELVRLSADQNLFSRLDLSHNPALENIELHNNPLSELHIDGNEMLKLNSLNLDGCRLPLSALVALTGKAKSRARFGNQEKVFFEQTNLGQNEILDLSSEAELDGVKTRFVVLTEKKRRVRPDLYTEEGGRLTFKAPGSYLVEMSNDKVFSTETNELTGRVRSFKVKAVTGLIEVVPNPGENDR